MESKNNIESQKIDKSYFEGILKKNPVLVGGLFISPVVVAAKTLKLALVLTIIFSIISLLTILISSMVPRNVVYVIRIILYSIIGSLVYVPVVLLMEKIYSTEIATLGIFVPLVITNSLVVSKSEVYFFRQTKIRMIIEVISYIIGVDVVLIVFGFIREMFSVGSIGGKIIGIPVVFPALTYPFGGFILLGLLAALFRKIYMSVRRKS